MPVVEPVTSAWDLESVRGLNTDGEKAREQIFGMVESVRVSVNRILEKASATPRLA